MARAILTLILAVAASAGSDPFLGTWKANFDKSSTTVPDPPPRPAAMWMRYEPAGGGYRLTAWAVTADGQTTSRERVVTFDGKEHPQSPDGPPENVVIHRKLDLYTEEIVYRTGDRVTTRIVRQVSADGKTLTYTSYGTSTAVPNKTVIVYEKSPDQPATQR